MLDTVVKMLVVDLEKVVVFVHGNVAKQFHLGHTIISEIGLYFFEIRLAIALKPDVMHRSGDVESMVLEGVAGDESLLRERAPNIISASSRNKLSSPATPSKKSSRCI